MRRKSVSIYEGESFWVECDITNQGGSTASSSRARLYLSQDDDIDVGDDYQVLPREVVGTLAAGETDTVRWEFTFPNLSEENTYNTWPVCDVDTREDVPESDEMNTWKFADPTTVGTTCQNRVLILERILPGDLTERRDYNFTFRGSGFSRDTDIHLLNKDTNTVRIISCGHVGCSVNPEGTEYRFHARTPMQGRYCVSMHECESVSRSLCGNIFSPTEGDPGGDRIEDRRIREDADSR